MCGCNSTKNGQCKNCNSSHFIGYDNPKSISLFPSIAPNTNGATCSNNTEYTDVSKFYTIKD